MAHLQKMTSSSALEPVEGRANLILPEGWHAYAALGIVVLIGLGLVGAYSVLLFHSAAEMVYVVAAFAVLAMAASLRRFVDDDYPLFLGVALAFTAMLHVAHMVAYLEIPRAPLSFSNLTTQFWVAGQYLGSASLLAAPLVLGRRVRIERLVALYGLLVLVLAAAIMSWKVFPATWGAGGLTAFKKTSEYASCAALVGALVLTYRRRAAMDGAFLCLMTAALLAAIASAIAFTLYVRFDTLPTLVGRLLMVVSIYIIFVAVSRNGIAKPVALRQWEMRRREEEATSQTKQVAEELRESEQRQQWLLEDSPLGVFIFGPDLVITECNERLAEIMGSSRQKLTGFDLNRLKDANAKAALEEALQGKQAAYEGPYQGVTGGRDVWVSMRASPLHNADGAVSAAIAGVADMTEGKRAEELVERLSFHDALTGLTNRTLFRDRLRQAIDNAERSHHTVAVAVIDLDHFKDFNDSIGHAAADRLLQDVALRLGMIVRRGDTLARTGGDEFSLLMPQVRKSSETIAMADRILEALRQPWSIDGQSFYVTGSVGFAAYPEDAPSAQRLLENADTAMHRAKELGRGGCQFYNLTMNLQTTERLTMERELRTAFDEEQLVVHYQPQIDLKDGRIAGVEALVRWQHPERGLLPPLDFIPVTEETGLIGPLGVWIVKTACGQAASWQALTSIPLRLAVNISPVRLRSPDLLPSIRAALQTSGLAPERLEIELTETAMLADAELAMGTLNSLRALGLTIALDDFGTGFSSLSHLSRLPINRVKVDRSFVSRIEQDEDAAAIVAAVTNLAHALGLGVVAEGVESEAQLSFLQRLGCDEAQGYLFARPMPAEECEVALSAGALLPALPWKDR